MIKAIDEYINQMKKELAGCDRATIQDALSDNKEVIIRYIDAKGDETTRMITPLHMQVVSGVVYLIAYCHLRQAERNFRLDRIFVIDRIG